MKLSDEAQGNEGKGAESGPFRYTTNDSNYLAESFAPVLGSEMEAMEADGFPVTPARLVLRAKDPASPLHRYFQWNDSVAAQEWRKSQAEKLIRSLAVVTVNNGVETKIRSHFSVRLTPPEEAAQSVNARHYISVREARSDPETREEVLQQALKECRSWMSKYQAFGLVEFQPVYEAIASLGK